MSLPELPVELALERSNGVAAVRAVPARMNVSDSDSGSAPPMHISSNHPDTAGKIGKVKKWVEWGIQACQRLPELEFSLLNATKLPLRVSIVSFFDSSRVQTLHLGYVPHQMDV